MIITNDVFIIHSKAQKLKSSKAQKLKSSKAGRVIKIKPSYSHMRVLLIDEMIISSNDDYLF